MIKQLNDITAYVNEKDGRGYKIFEETLELDTDTTPIDKGYSLRSYLHVLDKNK